MKPSYFLPLVALIASPYAVSAGAIEAINIPSSAAIERHAGAQDHCSVNLGTSIYADVPAPASCYLDFPIEVPINRTIDQIYVIYGSTSAMPNPNIDARLAAQTILLPYNKQLLFPWLSSAPVPDGTFATAPLMSQSGNVYTSAFSVRGDTVYHVLVHLNNGASVEGLQVIYE
jgi:hypothetical protein